MNSRPSTPPVELAVVMPVYNEAACIAEVIRSWMDCLAALQIDFRLLVLNDGSTDATAQALAGIPASQRIEIVHKTNSGHGPTIMTGYRQAVQMAQWVFQVDSDDEMPPGHFEDLWREREGRDFLIGYRENRSSPMGRKFITWVSRVTVRLLFGRGIRDVNCPYRLMRASALGELLPAIPAGAFAPNVILSGLAMRRGLRLMERPIPHRQRRTGSASIVKWKLWRSAGVSFLQTIKAGLERAPKR